jgi:hypothetical protein
VLRFSSGAVAALIIAFGISTAMALSANSLTSQQVHSLVGTWSCVTHDSQHKTYHETDVDSMDGPWLRMLTTYPPQNGQPAATGTGFFGYDSKHGRWIVTSVDTTGEYSITVSTSHTLNGSQWTDAYPVDNATATFRTVGSTEFTVDVRAPDGHGNTVTSHQVCTRS